MALSNSLINELRPLVKCHSVVANDASLLLYTDPKLSVHFESNSRDSLLDEYHLGELFKFIDDSLVLIEVNRLNCLKEIYYVKPVLLIIESKVGS